MVVVSLTCLDLSFARFRADSLHTNLFCVSIHKQEPETPLDIFFRSFATFVYDPSLPPATSYANLHRDTKDGGVATPRRTTPEELC